MQHSSEFPSHTKIRGLGRSSRNARRRVHSPARCPDTVMEVRRIVFERTGAFEGSGRVGGDAHRPKAAVRIDREQPSAYILVGHFRKCRLRRNNAHSQVFIRLNDSENSQGMLLFPFQTF